MTNFDSQISEIIQSLESRVQELEFITCDLPKNPNFETPNALKTVSQVSKETKSILYQHDILASLMDQLDCMFFLFIIVTVYILYTSNQKLIYVFFFLISFKSMEIFKFR